MKTSNTQKKSSKNREEKNVTSAKDWLDMDIKSQEGAIWVDSNSNEFKGKKYKPQKESASILKPDPLKYGNRKILNESNTIDSE